MIGNIVVSLVLPWLIPLFSLFLDDADNLPKFYTKKNGQRCLLKKINAFGRDLPAACIANIVWGFTLQLSEVGSDYLSNLKAYYYIMTIIQIVLIVFVRSTFIQKHGNICYYIYWSMLTLSILTIIVVTVMVLFL